MKTLAITFDLSLIDHFTLVIAITGYCIVLIALSIMAYFFTRLHTFQDYLTKRRVDLGKAPEKKKIPKR